jgi:DNA repair exonuclease SbcCD nuclease subunit
MKLKNKKIGSFSDIHLGLGQDSEMWHEVSLNFAKWASQKFLEEGIDDIFIPGDIFHNRNEISVETLSIAKQFFDYFKDFNIIISTGNHDSFLKNDSNINSISIFDGWKNIKIVDKTPLILETDFNKKITFVPWGYDIEKLEKVDIIFGHFEIVSFYMNNYKQCDHGLSYSNLFNKAKLIVSGHFHKRDHRTYKEGDIVYLGSPYQQNFGAVAEDKGIYIFDLEKHSFSFIENTLSPKHYKISAKKLINDEYEVEELKKIIHNNIVALVVDLKIEHDIILGLNTKINNMNPLVYRLEYLENEEDIQKISNEENFNSGDLLKDIEEYINTLDIDHKKEVVEYLKEMYNSLV